MRFKLIFAAFAFALATAITRTPASAAPCTQQTVWTTGETMSAALLNADPNYLYNTCLQNLDNTNIGAAGIFPSQLIPTTNAQATFGGSASILYSFPGETTWAPYATNQYPYAPVSVFGNDTSSYYAPSGEAAGGFNPAISSDVTQTGTGIPTAGMFVTQGAFGSNTMGNPSLLAGSQSYGILNSGANNNSVVGAYAQATDNSAPSGHTTTKGDAIEIGLNAFAANNSQDPSSSALGFCGTADCLQGMQRSGVSSTSNGTYPIVNDFFATFSTAIGGGADNEGNRPYDGFLAFDAISADFQAGDPQKLKTVFSQNGLKATYGFLSSAKGIATSTSGNFGSAVTGWQGQHWNGSAAAVDTATQSLIYSGTGTSPASELLTVLDGYPVEGSYDHGEHEFDGNDSGANLTNRLADIVANNPYTYQTIINEGANATQESDYINASTSATATAPAHAWYTYISGVLSLLGYVARDGSAHFANTPLVYINGTSIGDGRLHEELFSQVSVGTTAVALTFGTPYGSPPVCTMGPYNTGIKFNGAPTTTAASVIASTSSSVVDVDCKGQ